jgi:DNA-binding transcriptional MerR regulator
MKEFFIRKEVKDITEIPARRVQFYTEQDLLTLDETNPGRGRERRYSRQNLFELLVIRVLSRFGVELSKIKEILIDGPERFPEAFKKFNYKHIKTLIERQSEKSVKSIHYLVIDMDGRISLESTRTKDQKIHVSLINKNAVVLVNLNHFVEQIEMV